MSYYRNPVATQRRASYFNPPDTADYAMLSFVSITDLERVTGAAFRATSAPARMPSAVMVVDVDDVQSGAEAQCNRPQTSFLAQPASVVSSGEISALTQRQQEQREHREHRAMMEARKQEIIWEKFDAGEMTAADFEPMPKPKEFIQAPRQHEYHGGYYGSYRYYSRNR